jgi:hypothetical protein
MEVLHRVAARGDFLRDEGHLHFWAAFHLNAGGLPPLAEQDWTGPFGGDVDLLLEAGICGESPWTWATPSKDRLREFNLRKTQLNLGEVVRFLDAPPRNRTPLATELHDWLRDHQPGLADVRDSLRQLVEARNPAVHEEQGPGGAAAAVRRAGEVCRRILDHTRQDVGMRGV